VARLLAVTALVGCAAGRAPGEAAGRSPGQSFSDPFAYCAAVGTIDAPDESYTGPPVPDAVARGLREAFRAPASAPLEVFARGTSWRCMDGKVYACTVGANLPCQGRADTDRAPRPPLADFCHQNPDADVVPMVVTGRETVYEWRCAGGAPVIVRQVTSPDARGFLSNIWHEIRPGR
jgi:hypothetical protein